MQARLKRWGVLAVGWMFVLLGIAGLFLPILQGVLFIVIGLLILSTEYAWAHQLVRKLIKKFPWVEKHIHRSPRWVKRWVPHNAYPGEQTRETPSPEHENVAGR